MTRTLRYLLLFVFTGLSASVFAQEIGGRVLDEKKEPLPSAAVQVYQGGILKGGNITDYDGNFTIKPLDPGTYEVLVSYTGYDSQRTTGVIVSPGDRTTVNFNMQKPVAHALSGVVVKAYKVPLVDQDKPDKRIIGKDEIQQIPTTEISDIVATTPGIYQQQRGGDIFSQGSRSSGMLYIVDGVQVRQSVSTPTAGTNNSVNAGSFDMAQGSVDQIEVIASGIPANYGDVSGAVVNITSRGPAQKLSGDLRVQHSIDGYNNNMINFSLAGPVFRKSIDGDKKHKRTVLGFSFSGDYYDDHDRYPYYNEQYVVNSNVMKQIQQNPLTITSDNSGQPVYNLASDYVTLADMHQVRIMPNDEIKEIRLNGKLDYQINDQMRLVGGGTFDETISDYYNRYSDLFAPSSIPVQYTPDSRVYLRFTQKFGNGMKDTSSKNNIISNAFYSLQADYQTVGVTREDPNFKQNIFYYGYIGKFNETKVQTYAPAFLSNGFDSLTGIKGTVLTGTSTTGITFTPSPENYNPILANYTKEYYASLNGALPTQITQIQSANAMANGDNPSATYSYQLGPLWASPGTTQNYYVKASTNQYGLTVDANFDLQLGGIKHAIQFGLYYQQRIYKTFEAISNYSTTLSLWGLMRQLVSSIDNGNLRLDKLNPIFIVNGVRYTYSTDANGNPVYTNASTGKVTNVIPSPSDTIVYNYQNVGNSTFDQNLRKELGLSSTADINIDALSPSTFNLGMFSADELWNSGINPFVQYQGYTYTGASQGNVNFNDFWTAKDANGNFTRPIGAFEPNYLAGYIMDNFKYKDIHFNIGVRIDRYSVNTKVLKDPYSLVNEETVSQVPGSENVLNGGKHPSDIGGNYVVYVDDNTSLSPNIVGYRSGVNWYNPYGQLVQDPSVLTQYSGGRDPEPQQVPNGQPNTTASITDSNYNPNTAFTDYTPQVRVQPRVQFSFPISDVADFFAHYDIYSQRPTEQQVEGATPATYYYLSQNPQAVIDNPALQPQTTYDYEVGFQQKLSSTSALTLNAFYKERKDMITVVPYLYAWPTTYYSYGNRDFSTTDGMSLYYDLRPTNHLRLSISYTLQFSEGSGSTPTSANSSGAGQISPNGLIQEFITAGEPNLRYVVPLDQDSRHNIQANISYRYAEGEGPIVDGLHILQNAGIDLIPHARSGEPYTRYTDALGNTVIGGVNGARLPWHFGVDMRIDKDFALNNIKKHNDAVAGIKPKRPLFITAYFSINNLLNTRDIIGVYGYTGKPNDNGYISSSYGAQYIPQQVSPQAYTDQLAYYLNNPLNYNWARTVNFGLDFKF